jgi:hypothetical protein
MTCTNSNCPICSTLAEADAHLHQHGGTEEEAIDWLWGQDRTFSHVEDGEVQIVPLSELMEKKTLLVVLKCLRNPALRWRWTVNDKTIVVVK